MNQMKRSNMQPAGFADRDAEDVANMSLQPAFYDKEINQHPRKRRDQQRQNQVDVDKRAHRLRPRSPQILIRAAVYKLIDTYPV
jgi:hypothetical protein